MSPFKLPPFFKKRGTQAGAGGLLAAVLVLSIAIQVWNHPGAPASSVKQAVLAGGPCFAYTQAGSTVSGIQQKASALATSPCAGISWVFGWDQIETAHNVYDWSLVDAAIAASGSKKIILRVKAGVTSPTWVKTYAQWVTVPNGWMPVPWENGFLLVWDTFTVAFGARYNGNPQIALIETAGTGQYGESFLPGTLALWQSVGYTDAVYLAAIERIVAKFAGAFPSIPVSLDVSSGVAGGTNMQKPQVDWLIASSYANTVYVQQNGLSANSTPGHQVVQVAPLFGFQMIGVSSDPRTGDFCTALKTDLVDGGAFVEVYYADAIDPAQWSTIRYLNNGLPDAACP